MTNLLNSTLTHLTVEDAIFEHERLKNSRRFKSSSLDSRYAVCGDTLTILKQRLLINAYSL